MDSPAVPTDIQSGRLQTGPLMELGAITVEDWWAWLEEQTSVNQTVKTFTLPSLERFLFFFFPSLSHNEWKDVSTDSDALIWFMVDAQELYIAHVTWTVWNNEPYSAVFSSNLQWHFFYHGEGQNKPPANPYWPCLPFSMLNPPQPPTPYIVML